MVDVQLLLIEKQCAKEKTRIQCLVTSNIRNILIFYHHRVLFTYVEDISALLGRKLITSAEFLPFAGADYAKNYIAQEAPKPVDPRCQK